MSITPINDDVNFDHWLRAFLPEFAHHNLFFPFLFKNLHLGRYFEIM